MRRSWCAAAALVAVVGPARAGDLALQRVVLSTGGVGYFEYAATVSGDAGLTLDVPLDQVDDILKSLVVYDATGTVGELTLPGREPLAHSFADLPFDRAAFQSLPALLNELQGARLRVGGGKPMEGRLLRVVAETQRQKDGATLTRHRVTLMTADGVEQFVLEDADSIGFADPELQKQVEDALSRIAAYRGKGLRRLRLESHGAGSRTVRVSYVVGVPLWKATYRLSLPAPGAAGPARLQGWAVLENFSGQPWHGVELTLMSGNPVTFRQALYESYYVQRPTVPVEVAGRVLPPADTGAVAAQRMAKALIAPARGMPPGAANEAAAPAPPPPAAIEAATARETAVDTAFTLPRKVDVAAGQSVVVPILDRAAPATRIDLYRPASDPRHPLAAIALANDGKTGLPPGVLTLYQQPPPSPPPHAGEASGGALYLGDARLAVLPAGDKRLLSYAVDGKILVDRSSAQQDMIVNGVIAQGVMRLTRRLRQTTTYRIRAASPGEHRLLIEQPRLPGWSLAAPDRAQVTMTADAYRIPATVAGGKEAVMTVTLERPLEETIRLLDLSDDRLGVLAAATELSPPLRHALADITARRQKLAQRSAEVADLKAQRDRLVQDENRLRANLAAVGRDTALYKQSLEQLGRSESQIAALEAAIDQGNADLAAQRRQLRGFIANLSL